MSNFRKRNRNNNQKPKEIIVDIRDDNENSDNTIRKDIKLDTELKTESNQILDDNQLLNKYNSIKNLNTKLLKDIDEKDKKIKSFNKQITDSSLRHRKELSDNQKEHMKVYKKINKNIKNYDYDHKTFTFDIKQDISNYNDFLIDSIQNTNNSIDKINYIYQKEIEYLKNKITDMKSKHNQDIKDIHNKQKLRIKDLKDEHENTIVMIHKDYKVQINNIREAHSHEINQLKDKHDKHVHNIKTLNDNEKNKLVQDITDYENLKNKNINLTEKVDSLYKQLNENKSGFQQQIKFYENSFTNSQNNIKIFEDNLIRNIKGLVNTLKADRFSHEDFYNVCIYDKTIEYDFEFKQNLYSIIFYDIKFEEFNFYVKSKYISKYMNMIKHLENFIESDKNMFLYIDSDIKIIEHPTIVKKHLDNISSLDFDFLLLSSDDNYNFINKTNNFIKLNDISSLDSFIVNKLYAKKLMLILNDSINKIIKKENTKIEKNIDKILNDKNCFLYHPQFFKNKYNKKTLFLIQNNSNIDTNLIGYNYEVVDKTHLKASYQYNGVTFIPENDDYIVEIIKHYSKLNYNSLFIINDDCKLQHKKLNNLIRTNYDNNLILIESRTNSVFINLNKNTNYDTIFNDSNNVEIINLF